MRIFGSQSVKHSRGKYQKRLQAILLALLFSALLLLAVFFSLLYYQKTEKSWLGGWQSYAWFERDSFNTRNFLMHTEIETLTTDPTILAFAERSSGYSYETILAFKRLQQNTIFFSTSASSLALTSAYPDARLITALGTMSKSEFFTKVLNVSAEQDAAIKQFFTADSENFLNFPLFEADGSLKEVIEIYKRSTPGHTLIFVVRLDKQYFVQTAADYPFILLEHDQKVFAKSEPALTIEQIGPNRLTAAMAELRAADSADDVFLIKRGQQQDFILYDLPDTDYTLAIFVPQDRTSILLLGLLWLCLVPLLIAAALIVSRNLSKHLYKPVQTALLPLEVNPAAPASTQDEEVFDEVEQISRRMSAYHRLREDLEKLQHENLRYQDQELLLGLIDGRPVLDHERSSLMDELEQSENTIAYVSFTHAEPEQALLGKQEFQALCAHQVSLYYLPQSALSLILLFVGQNQAESTQRLAELLRETPGEVQWYAAISETRPALAGISESYNECVEMMDYRYQQAENSFIFARDLPAKRSNYYYYPVESEQILLRYIVGGQEQALTLFDRLIRENFEKRSLSADARRDLIQALVHTLRRAFQEVKIAPEKLPAVRRDILDSLAEGWDKDHVATDIRRLLAELLNYKELSEASSDDLLREKILLFIKENYADDIMLIDLSEFLGVTPKYCSALFAKLIDSNFKEYLNRFRVEQAAQIMQKSPDIPVSDLASAVGFNSSSSFIRVFRQHMGITPGKYLRENSDLS